MARALAGRVNLIGEHIDYEGYSVLPMAIRQDMIVAIRRADGGGQVRVANVDDKYATCVYPADPDKVILCSAPPRSALFLDRFFCFPIPEYSPPCTAAVIEGDDPYLPKI